MRGTCWSLIGHLGRVRRLQVQLDKTERRRTNGSRSMPTSGQIIGPDNVPTGSTRKICHIKGLTPPAPLAASAAGSL